ncbi:MAG: AsmA family protein [Acidocella sp.]|nr:AsmA family protein [Acidocella sp.]
MKRALLALLALVVVLPALVASVLVASFNPNDYAPQIAAAVQKATGRTLIFGGPIRLTLSLTPTIGVDDVTLSNPTGFADANFVTLQRLEAKIALWPLFSHHIDILSLILANPRINFQTNEAGQANWDFAAPAAHSRNLISGYDIALESVDVQNALITLKDAGGHTRQTLTLQDVRGTADSIADPLKLTAMAAVNNVPVTLRGMVGPVERLSGIGSGPWPVALTLAGGGAQASINGTVAYPRTASGYNFTLNASIPALEKVAPMLPAGLFQAGPLASLLPPIHGLTVTALIADQGSAMPAIRNLSIKAAGSDLSSLRPGLTLNNLAIAMPSLNAAVTLNAAASLGGMPLTITGNFGAMARLLNPAWLPATAQPGNGNFPVTLQAQAGSAILNVSGGLATPANASGVALAVSLTIPDLSALSPLAGFSLPAWKNIALQTTITDPGGLGLGQAAGLDGLALTMDNAALGGDASLYFGKTPRLQVALKGQQIDLDALRAAFPAPAATNAAITPASFIVSSAKLPLDAMKNFDADIQLAADSVVFNKATYTALQGHAVLQDGVLTLNPLSGLLPGGDITASASLDATKDPAAASWSLNAPALALGPILKSFGAPDKAQGTMQVALSATGTGDSLHDILASANGQLGLASVNSVADGAVLGSLFGPLLRADALANASSSASFSTSFNAPGPVPVRCLALRLDTANGIASISTLTLESSRLRLQGSGKINFGDETLALTLQPSLLNSPPGTPPSIGAPVTLGGSFAAPTLAAAPAAALPDSSNDLCPAALALGRLGKPGPAAEPPVSVAPAATGTAPPAPSGPKNLLNLLNGQ